MPRNVEIKARVRDVASLTTKVASIADSGPVEIIQDDTFFRCDTGRLKLRAFSSDKGELIYYTRSNLAGPKESFYIRSETSDPGALAESLALAYGTVGRVRKVRQLYMVGRTRIHLDAVQELGDFLELEVVLEEDEAIEVGAAEAERIMSQLAIDKSQLLESAYVDIMNEADDTDDAIASDAASRS